MYLNLMESEVAMKENETCTKLNKLVGVGGGRI